MNTPLAARRLAVLASLASLTAASAVLAQVPPELSPTRPAPAGKGGAAAPAMLQAPNAPATPVDNRPAIRFEPSVLDLGEMIADTAKTGTVTIFNILDKPIKINRIVPGCGCTTTGAPPGEIAPGASATVDITMKPGPKPGVPMNKTVTFQIDGHAPQLLTVKGDVKAFVLLSADMIDGPASDDAPPTSVTLTSVDNVPFKVRGSTPDVLVSIPEGSALKHEVAIDWKKWQAAGSSVKLAILTDHPKAAQLSLLVKRSIKPGAEKPVVVGGAPLPATILAARSGDAAALKQALATGMSADAEDAQSKRTALHFAAESGNAATVTMLLEAKANPNAKDRTGKTPVTIAAERGKAEVLAALLKAGGNPNERDQVQGSPLLWGAGLGTPETVALLLDAGADPNITDVNGMTPLMWAAGVGKPETVELLVAKGAKTDAVDRLTGETAFMRALRTGKPETVKILMASKPDLAQRNSMGMTPFLVACGYGDVQKITMLMDAGADLTAKDNRGWGAIDHAKNRVDTRRDEVVKFIEPKVPASTATAPPQPEPSK